MAAYPIRCICRTNKECVVAMYDGQFIATMKDRQREGDEGPRSPCMQDPCGSEKCSYHLFLVPDLAKRHCAQKTPQLKNL